MASQKETVKALLDRHGQTFAEELGIDVAKNTASPLFRLLCASVLLSARISTQLSMEAARSLAKRGWRTAPKLAESTWEQRVKALNEAGYTRYQERTATMLGDMTEHLLEEYDGDLRKLRDAADRDPKGGRKGMRAFEGLRGRGRGGRRPFSRRGRGGGAGAGAVRRPARPRRGRAAEAAEGSGEAL